MLLAPHGAQAFTVFSSLLYYYVVIIMALSDTNPLFFSYGGNGYMNRIRNLHFKFTSVVVTKKTKLRISLYFEDV